MVSDFPPKGEACGLPDLSAALTQSRKAAKSQRKKKDVIAIGNRSCLSTASFDNESV
jgi:hypothetical protein